MIKYVLYITEEQSTNADRARSDKMLVHREEFENYGSMLLWARAWFKTQGAHRKPQQIKLPNKKLRYTNPKDHAIPEFKFDMNIFGYTQDFKNYSRESFHEAYDNVYGYYAEQNAYWQEHYQRDFFDLTYGIEVVELFIEMKPNDKYMIIRTLHVKLEDNDNEAA
jgi:hypothetical protein